MAKKIAEEPKYICIRECFTFNKHFLPGDPFPNNWIEQDYKPNKHFAPAAQAAAALRAAREENLMYGPGDDPRSTKELAEALAQYTEIDGSWPRKKIWYELMRREQAANMDAGTKAEKKSKKPSKENGPL